MVEALHRETELVYHGTTCVHEGLGMFVLVIMSHGGTGTITGCDNKHVRLVDIYNLLSSQNFPAMRGKPKLVIHAVGAGGMLICCVKLTGLSPSACNQPNIDII